MGLGEMQSAAQPDQRVDARPRESVTPPETAETATGSDPSPSRRATGDASAEEARAAATTLEHTLTLEEEPGTGVQPADRNEQRVQSHVGGHVARNPAEASARKAALAAAVRATRDSFREAESIGEEEAGRVPPLAIAILVAGTRGDVQPFIALAMALQV